MNTTKNFSRWAVAGVGMMIFAQALSGFAATTSVLVGPSFTDTFSPSVVNINAGDQIIWTWQGTFHSTTSGTLSGTPPTATPVPNGIWDSGVATSLPHSFTNSFPSAGNFPFFCSVHYNFGMTGQVNVAAVALPPTVSITNPVNNATFSAPASFSLAATAASSGGTVTNVLFFQGVTSLGSVTASPYSVPVNGLAAADYTFSAVASDNAGLTATNAITIHVVTAVPIVLSGPHFLSPTDFQFSYTANTNLNYIIQRATNLGIGNWTTLSTNTATGSPMLFDDTTLSGSPAFYRVGLLPNP
jgi:plastocyanin